ESLFFDKHFMDPVLTVAKQEVQKVISRAVSPIFTLKTFNKQKAELAKIFGTIKSDLSQYIDNAAKAKISPMLYTTFCGVVFNTLEQIFQKFPLYFFDRELGLELDGDDFLQV